MNTLPATGSAPDACWRRIGVAGDRSCPELVRHVHCRNCGVIAGAAQRNLQRPVEPGYREDWARELARALPAQAASDACALLFRVGTEWLALPVALAASVAPSARVQRLPHRGGALLGVVNVDGRLVPAVAPGELLGIAPAPPRAVAAAARGRHAFARLLVLSVAGQSFALPVDEVRGLVRFVRSAVLPPVAGVGVAGGALVEGVLADGGARAGLLAADALGARLMEALR